MSVIISEIKEAIRYYKRIPDFRKVTRAFERGEESLPISISVQTISACNAECVFCPYPYVSKTLPQGVMPWETYKKIVDECASFEGLTNFSPLLQNEPLIDKNIGRAVTYFKERNNGRTPVQISTNGYLITENMIRDLVNSGLDYLVISLNALNEDTYEKLLPGFKFNKIMNNIEKLLSLDLGKMKFLVRFLATSKNEQEIKEAVKYWHNRGVMTEVITLLHNRGGAIDIGHLKPKMQVQPLRKKINKIWFNIFTTCCVVPFRQMYILYNGDVLLCGNDWRRELILGNVNKNSIREIWNGSIARQIRKKILQKKYEDIPPCSGCTMTENYGSWR